MLFETFCSICALLVKTVSSQEPETSESAFRSARAPRGTMSPRSALCFYLLRGKVKQCYMFLFVLLASTFGAQRRNANLSYTAPLFALACCADVHAVILWLQPTSLWEPVFHSLLLLPALVDYSCWKFSFHDLA